MSEKTKNQRIFVFNEFAPDEFERLIQTRRVKFDSAYLKGWERVFRTDPAKSPHGIATLHAREKSFVFGYHFTVKQDEMPLIDKFMGVDKGVRNKQLFSIGYGQSEVGNAVAYLTRYKNFSWPTVDALKTIAAWENRFWPRVDDTITWREIGVR